MRVAKVYSWYRPEIGGMEKIDLSVRKLLRGNSSTHPTPGQRQNTAQVAQQLEHLDHQQPSQSAKPHQSFVWVEDGIASQPLGIGEGIGGDERKQRTHGPQPPGGPSGSPNTRSALVPRYASIDSGRRGRALASVTQRSTLSNG